MSPMNPTDWAIMLLALGGDPPRLRARDQQADRAGGNLRLEMLDRIVTLEPEADGLEQALAQVVDDVGEPSGPPRAIAISLLQEWQDAQSAPGYWPWLISEALEATAVDPRTRRKRRRAEQDG